MKKHTENRTTQKIIETLQLPKDICQGAIKVSLIGNTDVWIENYRGILEYTSEKILLQGKGCQVCFEGEGLSVDYYTNEDMKIRGRISKVKYME